jgi:hypothetical protein
MLLIAALCWAPVLLDCAGGIEWDVRYHHEVASVYVIGTQPCGYDEEGQPVAEYGGCPIYASTDWVQTAFDADPCLPWEPPDPEPGGVVLMRVTAVDAAENVDCGLPANNS